MAINYIDSVSVDGLGNAPDRKLFNGYIYNLNYKIGVAGDKSEVVVNLWSEDGQYSINKSDINWNRIYRINIGNNIVFNGYLVKYSINRSTKATAELKFIDTSCKMDKYFVGLKNRAGSKSRDNLIIVGREIHPCDKNYDGEIDSIPELKDTCHPCRNQAERTAEFKIVNCKEMNYATIFDVKYNFTMLIAELRKYFQIQPTVTDPNPKYFKNNTGTVREVLTTWCADFGWIFYWENDTIKFIDSRKRIDVKTKLDNYAPNLSEFTEEYSVENSFDRIVGTYYERAGTRDKYECEDAMHFKLPIFEPNRADLGAELQITAKIPHIAAGLVQYDDRLRDLWYWYDKYSLRKPEDYYPGRKLHKVGLELLGPPIMLDGRDAIASATNTHLEPSTGLVTSSLQPSTGLGIPTGMPVNPDPLSTVDFLKSSVPTESLAVVQQMIRSNPKYKSCFELLKAEDQWVVANGLAKNKDDYFFFIGYYDGEVHNSHKNIEKEYGAKFLNRFHIHVPDLSNPLEKKFFEDYTFIEDEVCGIKVKNNDSKIAYSFLGVGTGDTPIFFNTPSESVWGNIKNLSDLPFHKWLKIFRDSEGSPSDKPDAIEKLAASRELMFRLAVIEKKNESFYPSPDTRESGDTDDKPVKDEIKNERLIGLAAKNSLIRLEERNNEIGEFVPRKLLEDSKYPLDKSIDRSKVFIFVGRSVADLDYKITTQNAINPSSPMRTLFNGDPIKTDYQDEFDIKGEVFYKYKDLKCKEIGNILPFCYRRSFKTPVGTFTYYEPTYSAYGMIMQKVRHIDHTIKKLQLPMWSKTKIVDNVGAVQVIEKNISDEEISIFKNVQNTCRYDLEKIRSHHRSMASHLSLTQDTPVESFQFKIEGVDLSYTPRVQDGLIGIDISVDSDGGVSSTYHMGTTLSREISNLDILIGTDEFTKQKSITSLEQPYPHKK